MLGRQSLLFLAVLAVSSASLWQPADSQKSPSEEDRLHSLLFKDYNKQVKPDIGNGSVPVKFGLTFICVDLSPGGILDGHVWYRITWTDPRLAWNPEDFGNTTLIRTSPFLLWQPDIILYNRDNSGDQMLPFSVEGGAANAIVYSNGEVLAVPDARVQARCGLGGLDLSNPWAEQNCTLKFGSWTYDGYKLDLQLYRETIALDDYSDNCPVEIVSSSVELENKFYPCCDEPYPNAQFKVSLRRRYLVTPQGVVVASSGGDGSGSNGKP